MVGSRAGDSVVGSVHHTVGCGGLSRHAAGHLAASASTLINVATEVVRSIGLLVSGVTCALPNAGGVGSLSVRTTADKATLSGGQISANLARDAGSSAIVALVAGNTQSGAIAEDKACRTTASEPWASRKVCAHFRSIIASVEATGAFVNRTAASYSNNLLVSTVALASTIREGTLGVGTTASKSDWRVKVNAVSSRVTRIEGQARTLIDILAVGVTGVARSALAHRAGSGVNTTVGSSAGAVVAGEGTHGISASLSGSAVIRAGGALVDVNTGCSESAVDSIPLVLVNASGREGSNRDILTADTVTSVAGNGNILSKAALSR